MTFRPPPIHSALPPDPRVERKAPGVLARVGLGALGAKRTIVDLLRTLIAALAQGRAPGIAARRLIRRITMVQILFTGVEALPLISVVALLFGATIIIQMHLMAPSSGGELIGKVLVAVVLREMAPLTTAIVIASRSGTAIATELGNMKVSSEILALSSMGVDPLRFIVYPRLIGVIVSVVVLTVYFSVVGIAGGYGVSLSITEPSFEALRAGFSGALVPADLALFLVKGAGLGSIVGWFSCHFGLEVRSSPTEVPKQASRAVVASLVGCIAFNTLVTAAFYWIVGPPVH